jgi:HD-like signal output (HDOD) protein
MTDTPTIEELISGIPRSLGSYAPVLEEIEAALQSPQCSLSSVGEALEKEPDLTARLLRLANSAFYGYATRLATVTEAVSLIGIQQVQDLIVASSIIERFAGLPDHLVNMKSFWSHSLACGVGARWLAMERRLPNSDKFFVAGLLHDLGRLVLFSQAPPAAKRVFEAYQQQDVLLYEAERQVLGYDHQDIARQLLRHWNYPEFLTQAVANHHQPMACPAAAEAAVVHASDHLVNAMQIGNSGECFVPPLNGRAWEALGLDLQSVGSMMSAVDEQMEAVGEVFLSALKEAA